MEQKERPESECMGQTQGEKQGKGVRRVKGQPSAQATGWALVSWGVFVVPKGAESAAGLGWLRPTARTGQRVPAQMCCLQQRHTRQPPQPCVVTLIVGPGNE